MRKYLRVIPIIVSALLVSLVGTIFVDKGSLVDASHLQNLTNIVSIFTSLVLVAIGLILYEKFNGSQAIVDEQTKQVVSLLKIVNQTRFAVDVYVRRASVGTFYNIRVVDYKQRRIELMDNKSKDYRKYKNIADDSFLDLYSHLSSYVDEPYLPTKVVTVIKNRFYLGIAEHIAKTDLPRNYIKVSVKGDFEKVDYTDLDGKYRKYLIKSFNRKEFILDDLMFDLECVHNAARNWLKKNNKTVFNSLNIEEVQKFKRGTDIY